jgi:hypothetical protein
MSARKQRVPRPLTDTHIIRRTYDAGSFVPAAADYGLGFNHTLSQLPTYGDFTALFDAYRIQHVSMKIVYHAAPTGVSFPTVLWCFDPDDNTAPATESVMLERQGTKIQSFSASRPIVQHSYRPTFAAAGLTVGGVQRQIIASRSQWCDMAAVDTSYYGCKVWLAGFNTTATPSASITVYFTYTLGLRFAR